MFLTARWKSYITSLQKKEELRERASDPISTMWHFYHSQMIWFTRDEDNGYARAARENLEKCDSLLKECTVMNDNLQEVLANTPKPSQVFDWSQLW